MLDQIYVVTDLGPGDGGKGGVVHALSGLTNASIIIKRGGAQGSHGVRTSRGESFNFSQWGCGTLEGIPTYLSPQMVIMPVGLANESNALRRLGIYDPYTLLTADPFCICATPFHKISSQIEEILLGSNPRGTIGTGVGQAYRMFQQFGYDMTIVASELSDRVTVRAKLKKQREYYRSKYVGLAYRDVSVQDAGILAENLLLLQDDDFLPFIIDLFDDVGKKLELVALEAVLRQKGSAIVECSHGVLTDAATGLKPHVSAIRTLPHFTQSMLRDAGFDGAIRHLAVHRAYEIRHGAGPMPTYDPDFTKLMLPHSHKDANRWQGSVRAGALDFNLLRFAIENSRDIKFDGICLTWFDQILATDRNWMFCDKYEGHLVIGESYTNFLKRVRPIIERRHIKQYIRRQELLELANHTLQCHLGLPLSMLSVGPTELDKLTFNL